jgi:hypothetical protein
MKTTLRQSVEDWIKNGIYYSVHSTDKMRQDRISETDIKDILLNGVIEFSRTQQIDRRYAHNTQNHLHSSYHNKVVVFCQSREKGVLVISVFNGKPYQIPNYR